MYFWEPVEGGGIPYVTATAPLALTQASSTWSAVALSRSAISLTGLSKGPPGWRVIGLLYFVRNEH